MRIFASLALVVAAIAVTLALTLSSTAAARRVTKGFTIGVMADGPVLDPGVSLHDQLHSMLAAGVESLRVQVSWATAQPYRSEAQVPVSQRASFHDVHGTPTDFAQLDRIVGPAAALGISVLPVVEYAPGWDALKPGDLGSAPRSTAPFAAFVSALARRYGPHGAYWSSHPGISPVPIRMWQIWNEPNFSSYWSVQPFAPSYVRLLGAARTALRAVDPGARVVLGGLPNFSWQYLAQIYRVPGASRTFDIVAVHPYTAHPRGVIEILQKVRAVMDRFGDRAKPMLATEVSWPASAGRAPDQFGFGTTPAGQAQRLDQVMPLLADNRSALGLLGFYWYTWMGDEGPRSSYAFDYAGLLSYVAGRISAKPVLGVFARRALEIEGCRRKATLAGVCG